MKKIFYCFYFCLIAVLVSACFSPWRGNGGNLTIVWGNPANSRAVHIEDLPGFDYKVILKGPGGTIEEDFTGGVPGASFSLVPGTWSVTVKGGKYYATTPRLEVMGIKQIEVRAGEKKVEPITMYNASEANNWIELQQRAENDSDPGPYFCSEHSMFHEEIIVLKPTESDSFMAESTISIARPIILVSEEPVTITRGPGSVYPNSIFSLEADLTLGLSGMTGTLTIDGNDIEASAAIFINSLNDPSLTMNKGVTIINNLEDGYGYGGGVIMYTGEFIMNGGSINNSCRGVHIYLEGKFTMNGGTISDIISEVNDGSGVCVDGNGTFIMEGGTISGNTASRGGGVYVAGGGSFIMNSGTISGNSVYDNGGGVYVEGSFEMNGGTISGNTAYYGNGGGVFVSISGDNFTMNGGTISGNRAENSGGGVAYFEGNFIRNGGTIKGNYPNPTEAIIP